MCVRPQRRPSIDWIEIDGDVVAVDPSNGSIHVLRGAAAAVWQLIDGEDLEGLEVLVAETFGVDPEVASRDIVAAVDMLRHIDLVTCAPVPDR